jgi:uncharacterized membrane protein YhaH (DUF805 family)
MSDGTADALVCPGCGRSLGEDIILCIECGYHRKLNRFLARTVAPSLPKLDSKNPYASPTSIEEEDAIQERGLYALLVYLFWIDGRAPRLHWWASRLLWFGWLAVGGALIKAEIIPEVVGVVTFWVAAWMVIAMDIKRWHDRDKSGLWCLLYLIPCVGPFWVLMELGMDRGDECRNDYGEDPLAPRGYRSRWRNRSSY